MPDVLTDEQRRYCMSRIRGKNTQPEILLRKGLWASGLRYRVKNKLTGHPDIIFPGRLTVIFVDGCFWHMCPEHFSMPKKNRNFWKPKLMKNVARDREINRILQKKGWKVIRIWEHEISAHLNRCVSHVRKTLSKRGKVSQ